MLAAMGGKCQLCGYDKCSSALAFHHKDPKEKDLRFGALRASPRNWAFVVTELRKCVLLCNNCHAEVHAGISQIPENSEVFNEDFVEYKNVIPRYPSGMGPGC